MGTALRLLGVDGQRCTRERAGHAKQRQVAALRCSAPGGRRRVCSARSVTRSVLSPLITWALVTTSPRVSKIQPVPSDSSAPFSSSASTVTTLARSFRPTSVSSGGDGVGALAAGRGHRRDARAGLIWATLVGHQEARQAGGQERDDGRQGASHGPWSERRLGPSIHEETLWLFAQGGITVVGGGGGALGSAVVSRLAAAGRRVVVPTRHPGRSAPAGQASPRSNATSTTSRR